MKSLRRGVTSQERLCGVLETGKVYMDVINLLVLLVSCCCCCINIVQALPFPAPNLHNCLSLEECCTPIPSTIKPTKFKFQTQLPMRIRPAAHLVDDDYIAKYQRAVELMKALPDTDGRSFTNQWKLHCLYCDNHLYFETETHPYPLEIHQSWLFFPWHRLYLYFHERILAKLIGDDTFALPFWNWDNQSPDPPTGTVVPRVYAEKRSLLYPGNINQTSPLYDDTRNPCALHPDCSMNFQSIFDRPMADQNATEIRAMNAHVMYVNTVGVAVTPLLFHGGPYRLGDQGGGGVGALEIIPHGSVHGWVNRRKMATFRESASDPIFFAHHANMDRLWEVWKTLPGGIRDDISDPDYLNTEFTFYDENGRIVTVSVAQALQVQQLRYKYQEVVNPWVANGAVEQGQSKHKRRTCSRARSPAEIAALIEDTAPLQGPVNFTSGSLTFKVRRSLLAEEDGEEILEVTAKVDHTQMFIVVAFAFHPEAGVSASPGCGEYLGTTGFFGHVGFSQHLRPEFVWRLGIRKQLELMGMDKLEYIVVTLTAPVVNQVNITFTGARVTHWKEESHQQS